MMDCPDGVSCRFFPFSYHALKAVAIWFMRGAGSIMIDSP
jgi:hypothetical protein